LTTLLKQLKRLSFSENCIIYYWYKSKSNALKSLLIAGALSAKAEAKKGLPDWASLSFLGY
jgi:hypothetical protein